MDFYQILALVGGAMIIFTTFPQLIKIIKTKKVDDLSLNMFLILIIAESIWLYYGLHINDLPLILTNGLSMVVVATNIGLIFKYRTAPTKN
jgi:MtN3 and saliva related transmembrane protein